MFLRAIDALFQLVYRFLCWLIIPPRKKPDEPKDKPKDRIGHDWQDDKGKWHRVIYVTDKDQPLP